MSAQLQRLEASVLEKVNEHFGLPFQPRPNQAVHIENLANLPRSGWYADPGCGKTLMSSVVALYKTVLNPDACTFVVCPPILVNAWVRWLQKIEGIGKVVSYKGGPKERERMVVHDAQFLVMSNDIFKRDRKRLAADVAGRYLIGIVDEATSVKNPGSDNHRFVRDFFNGHDLMLLTGTPLSNPGDAYAYVKLISPMIYRSERQFRNIHAAEEDFFGKVTKWTNLELMQENLLTNSMRMLKEEALADLKKPLYVPIQYELDRDHMALYNRLVEEQILILESGGKIDATGAARLYNAAQQVIFNYDHFSGDPDRRSAAWDVVSNTISEIGLDRGVDRKLIIFAQYRMTNRKLQAELAKYGAVACYSEISAAAKDRNIDRFMSDPTCKILVAHPRSAGMGLNPQEVCSDILFIEEPITPMFFHQAVGRIYRDGQPNVPVVRIAIAERTIQVRLHRQLLEKDELVNKVQTAYQDLREAINGK